MDSKRLSIVRFPLILLVLYIHSFIAPVNFAGGSVQLQIPFGLTLLCEALSNGIARVAVPLFFLMSGYLFFIGFDGSVAAYGRKLRARVGTLLVPYLLWNVLIASLYIVGQSLPQTAPLFSGSAKILGGGALATLDAVFGFTHFPIAYPFWFIRDLMVLAILALPLHLILTRTSWLLPALLVPCWVASWWFLPLPAIEATTWFTIGAALALRGRSLFAWEERMTLFAPLYLVLLIADIVMRLRYDWWWLHQPAIALGVATALCLPRYVMRARRMSAALLTLSGASFFVFAAQEPLMTLVRKLLYSVLSPTPGVVTAVYMLEPLAIAALLVAVYFTLRRLLPRFTATISGNRGA
ncbi:acyltransferase family protein [Sphingomonas immobilis]|uniref:acyltransferase family protein n=1 Tax=Sphingomonas immobilis TaxID=3063997 RepID=UPI00272A6653|nr:acyltransferase family protein [Sphingomonas sp. CA1-15]